MPQHTLALSPSAIAPKVHWIRHEKVILDFDLAALYGVETRVLKQAVRRNRGRFPEDFLFVLTADETGAPASQSVIPGRGNFGGAAPYAFTEQGVAMLSSVLRSTRAVQVNIAIMRTFVQLRRLMDSNRDLARVLTPSKINTTSNSASSLTPLNASSPKTKSANPNPDAKSAFTPSSTDHDT